MKLLKMLVFNRAPFDNLVLDFDNRNVTVLSGINGAGKTTLISYIVDSLYELAKKHSIMNLSNILMIIIELCQGLISLIPQSQA